MYMIMNIRNIYIYKYVSIFIYLAINIGGLEDSDYFEVYLRGVYIYIYIHVH
jgi:hypothetical protein